MRKQTTIVVTGALRVKSYNPFIKVITSVSFILVNEKTINNLADPLAICFENKSYFWSDIGFTGAF